MKISDYEAAIPFFALPEISAGLVNFAIVNMVPPSRAKRTTMAKILELDIRSGINSIATALSNRSAVKC